MGTIWPPDMSEATGPKYLHLLRGLRSAVDEGFLKEGSRLPPVRELAWELKITPGTVARAYRTAVEEGVLEAAVGRGTFVAPRGHSPIATEQPLANTLTSHMIDFRGCSIPDLGQGTEIATILAGLGQTNPQILTNYPQHSNTLKLRRSVMDWVGADHVGRMKDDDVVFSLGAQNGTMLVLQALLAGPHPVILTENLAYPGVRHAARLLRAGLHGLAMDDDGILPEALEAACQRTGAQVLLTSAEVHSPTTTRTSFERKQQIVDIARRHQLHIIEDDCHRIKPTEIPAYRMLYPERGWYVSSLSKSVSAALRFGYVICPADHARAVKQVADSSFYGIPSPMVELVQGIFETGLAERSRAAVVRRVEARTREAVNVLGRWQITWRPGAPFIWLRLPRGWRGSSFSLACEAQGIRIKSADEFALPDGQAPNGVRLAVNPGVSEDKFMEGLRKIDILLSHPPQDMDA